ncbi:MAG: hypothetical protein ACLFTK_07900 [Anaerolineales bacterium]
MTPAESTADAPWLSLTCYAQLPVVAAANYLRYGPQGVRRFHPGAATELAPHPRSLAIALTLKGPRGEAKYHLVRQTLQVPPSTVFDLDGVTTWRGDDPLTGLKIAWVWDFHRLYGGLRLNIQPPAEGAKEAHQRAWEALSTAQAGDKLVIEPPLQVFPVDDPPQFIPKPDPIFDDLYNMG